MKSRIKETRSSYSQKKSVEICKSNDNPFIAFDYDEPITTDMIIGKSDLSYLNIESIHDMENKISELMNEILLFENHLKESVWYSEEWEDLYKGVLYIIYSVIIL